MDVRTGGRWRNCLRSTETGVELWHRGVFREVVAPERIVFTFAWENADGSLGHELLTTVTFDEQGSKTRLTLRQSAFETTERRDDHRKGWTSTLERFAEYVTAQGG